MENCFSFKSNKIFSLRFCENAFLNVRHSYFALHILLLVLQNSEYNLSMRKESFGCLVSRLADKGLK